MMGATVQPYIHPDASATVLPCLLDHLPSALCQEYLINNPPSSSTIVVASFAPLARPPATQPWGVGIIDLSRPGETEFFFWSSTEDASSDDKGEQAVENDTRYVYAIFESMVNFIITRNPDKKELIVGSLHTSFLPFLSREHLLHVSVVWARLIFSLETLPPLSPVSEAIAQNYAFRKVSKADLEEVVATSTVQRTITTLVKMSSTGAYAQGSADTADARADAWCFTSMEGAVSTLFVRPELRGEGIGKVVMRQELEKGFRMRRFMSADVALTNEASARVCASLGATKMWETVWTTLDLDSFKRREVA